MINCEREEEAPKKKIHDINVSGEAAAAHRRYAVTGALPPSSSVVMAGPSFQYEKNNTKESDTRPDRNCAVMDRNLMDRMVTVAA